MSEDGGSAAPGRYDEALSVKGATTKATRERQRRIRLNDSFMELAKALDPGKTPKTDKASIVADAIRVVNQLRTENSQLQQLNKFLEERVSTHEKARSDIMMRQAMYHGLNQPNYMQQQQQQQQQPIVAGGVVMGQPIQGLPMQQALAQSGAPAQGHPPPINIPARASQHQACNSSRMEAKGENDVAPTAGPSGFLNSQPPSAMGQLSELLNSDPAIFDWALGDAAASPPDHGWLHLEGGPPDTTQDSLKRPPAA